MIDPELAAIIDSQRRKGASYDDVAHKLMKVLPPEEAQRTLDAYAKEALPDGRARGQVNLGDPAEGLDDA